MRCWGRWAVLAALVAALLAGCGGHDGGTGLGALGRGTCVTWAQGPGGGPTVRTSTVSCSDAHLAEVAGQVDVAGSTWPGPTRLQADGSGACPGDATEALGRPLDPEGRFTVEAIVPTEAAWASGNHRVTCAFVTKGAAGATSLTAWTGRVTDADQAVLLAVGTCLSGNPGATARQVSCTTAHSVEVTGTATAPATARYPTTAGAYTQLIGAACLRTAKAYLGGPLPIEVAAGWFPVTSASWAAGQRTVQCLVGRQNDGGGWIPVTGPLRAHG